MTRRDLLLLILAFVITRAALVGAGVIALRYYPPNEGAEFTHLIDGGAALDLWYRWDAGFYATIATDGYDWLNTRQLADDMAFLPLYPLAVHLVSGMTATGCLASPYLSTCATVGGLVVSNAALLIALLLLFDLARRRYGKSTAWRAALLLLVSPISIFLSGVYTEALFLLLAVLVFWLLERDRFGWAVIAAALACLTRSVGVALVPALLWYAWRNATPSPTLPRLQGRAQTGSSVSRSDSERNAASFEPASLSTSSAFGEPSQKNKRWYAPLPEVGEGLGVGLFFRLALVPGLIFAAYILIAGMTVGDPLAFFKTYDATWGRAAGTPIQAFTVYFSGVDVTWFGWRVSWIDLILTLFYLALAVVLLIRERTRTWGLFALFALLIPIASGTLIGMPRYGAVIFAFYVLLGNWADRWYKQLILYGASIALALLFVARFVTWRWIA